ncbi:MAG: hypothetical protein LBG18_09275, partial [Mediterranea sp.]|nr:hypothetical protein [Mediterranea sp.]
CYHDSFYPEKRTKPNVFTKLLSFGCLIYEIRDCPFETASFTVYTIYLSKKVALSKHPFRKYRDILGTDSVNLP